MAALLTGDDMGVVSLILESTMVNEYGRDLPEVLDLAARNNAQAGISAVLLCKKGKLMGLIQGARSLSLP
ncbi:hypothetical protein [Rhodoferax sp. GW822-FHT02A01]|uniref:hypothetical protein n=1 Tax=Rhodoferax sp. GW822-FHT02A01 TaxID=3141537 RepID=UPI00315DAB3C